MVEYTKIRRVEKDILTWSGSSEGLKPNWDVFDMLLELLGDTKWHSLKEIEKGIAEEIAIPRDAFAPILSLFTELDFISQLDEEDKVRIKPLGLRFLELPRE
ncbi:MAG: hypothetical protein WAV32_09180 [Halobacteriota archaeon]